MPARVSSENGPRRVECDVVECELNQAGHSALSSNESIETAPTVARPYAISPTYHYQDPRKANLRCRLTESGVKYVQRNALSGKCFRP